MPPPSLPLTPSNSAGSPDQLAHWRGEKQQSVFRGEGRGVQCTGRATIYRLLALTNIKDFFQTDHFDFFSLQGLPLVLWYAFATCHVTFCSAGRGFNTGSPSTWFRSGPSFVWLRQRRARLREPSEQPPFLGHKMCFLLSPVWKRRGSGALRQARH